MLPFLAKIEASDTLLIKIRHPGYQTALWGNWRVRPSGKCSLDSKLFKFK
jgi:hypothetical protein